MAHTENPTGTDPNVLVITDQLQRELVWSALAVYRDHVSGDLVRVVDEMIVAASQTFSWMRD